jgi:hypothetical protein
MLPLAGEEIVILQIEGLLFHWRDTMKNNNRLVLSISICLALVSLACSSSSTPSPFSTSTPPATQTETQVQTGPPPDLTTRPQIWLGPQAPSSPIGPPDYYDLFTNNAPWQHAARGTQVFKLYGPWLDGQATDEQIQQIVSNLQRRGMGIAFEAPPLAATEVCTHVIEGFGYQPLGHNVSLRIKQAGGTVDYADLEHPFDAVTFSGAPPECSYSAERAAQEVAVYVQGVRSVFPDVRIGAIETANHSVEAVADWVNAYLSVIGKDLDYFSLDVDYSRPNWAKEARAIEDYLRGRGIEFGIFYRGDENDTSSAEWIAKAEQRFVEYEAIAGGRPDRAIFQSWHPYPDHVLPESDPSAFTYLIDRYSRPRTKLTLNAQTTSTGGLTLSGTLTDDHGAPIPKANVSLNMTPLDGPGVMAEYTLSDIVPEGATQADVGYRVNMECDNCSGVADFTLYEVHYTQGKGDSNYVPNWKFANGLQGWDAWGEGGTWQLVPNDQGPGSALHVTAQPGQTTAINSTNFNVIAGQPFAVTFVARVAPSSEGSGYFSLVFLGTDQEIQRFKIPLQTKSVQLGKVTTGGSGAFEFQVSAAPAGSTLFQAWYAGDDKRWPAYAEAR